jgi:hypothetical protein
LDLPPEEKQRIYAEEKARQEAQEKVKQERDTKNFKTGCIGCLSIVAIVVLIMVFTGAFGSKNGNEEPGYVDLNAQVRFTGTQFVIVNEDSFDWLDVKLEVNPGTLSKGYELRVPRLEAGATYTVGVMQFTKSDGTRFNPVTTKPKSFSVFCATPNKGTGYYYGGWD